MYQALALTGIVVRLLRTLRKPVYRAPAPSGHMRLGCSRPDGFDPIRTSFYRGSWRRCHRCLQMDLAPRRRHRHGAPAPFATGFLPHGQWRGRRRAEPQPQRRRSMPRPSCDDRIEQTGHTLAIWRCWKGREETWVTSFAGDGRLGSACCVARWPLVRAVLFNALSFTLRNLGLLSRSLTGIRARIRLPNLDACFRKVPANGGSRRCRDRKSPANAVGAAPIPPAFRVCSRATGWRRRFSETDPLPAKIRPAQCRQTVEYNGWGSP